MAIPKTPLECYQAHEVAIRKVSDLQHEMNSQLTIARCCAEILYNLATENQKEHGEYSNE